MQADGKTSLAQSIILFLHDPRVGFVPFYAVCRCLTRKYLGTLRAKGWSLPIEDRLERDPLKNLADELLEHLFCVGGSEPNSRICAYFRKQGMASFDDAEPERLVNLFMPFFIKEIKQQLYELYHTRDPEQARIRERFKRILRSGRFTTITLNGRELICQPEHIDACVPDKPSPPRAILEGLAWEALLSAKTETVLVAGLFERMSELPEYLPAVEPRLLLQALVQVRLAFLEQELPSPAKLPPPNIATALAQLGTAVEEAVQVVASEVFPRWVRQGKLDEVMAAAWQRAIRLYLNDYWQDGGNANSPVVYYREVSPTKVHADYNRKYRYLFENTLKTAVDIVRERLRKYV